MRFGQIRPGDVGKEVPGEEKETYFTCFRTSESDFGGGADKGVFADPMLLV